MWHNTRTLNLLATGLIVLSVLIVGQLALAKVRTTPLLALRTAHLHGPLERVGPDDVEAALGGGVTGNFFSVDLEAVKQRIEGIGWVRSADVSRHWPDRLEIAIEEHAALGRWGTDRLVSVAGIVFRGSTEEPLPRLHGPRHTEEEVTVRFRRFREIARPLGSELVELELSERHAWRLRLASGLTVVLGRDQPGSSAEDRLARFVAAHARIVETLGREVKHVDLRYPNGFAVRVPGLGKESSAVKTKTGARPEGREMERKRAQR